MARIFAIVIAVAALLCSAVLFLCSHPEAAPAGLGARC